MGALVNGIKDIFSTSQTTATHLPVCASDGTPQGRISVGELANVLGATKSVEQITQTTNVDNIKYSCCAGIVCSSQNSTLPNGVLYGMFVCNPTQGAYTCFQTVYQTYGGNNIYVRVFKSNEQEWSEWMVVYTGLATFYKDYSTLAALGSALGVIKTQEIPENTDVNSLRGLRFMYQINSSKVQTLEHLPSGIIGGEIELFVLSFADFGVQILFHSSASRIYVRFIQGATLTAWKEIGLA